MAMLENRPSTSRDRHEKQNDAYELTQCGPDTPMGKLLRKFWQPVALSSDVEPGKATRIQIMKENLTLYRGESGDPHIVDDLCAHRLTRLHTGWVEGDCIRCYYHGWKYADNGQCVEMPAEDPDFPPKVRITSYPARDYAGMIFAYMGEGEPPPFNRIPELDRDYGVLWNNKQIWPCNWFQQVENSLDAVHVSFVHRTGRFGEAVTDAVPTLTYEETDWGMTQRAKRSETNIRESDWAFPNNNHIVVPQAEPGAKLPWADTLVWMVPVDDEHTLRFAAQQAPWTGEAAEQFRTWLAGREPWNPADHEDELFAGKMPEDPNYLIGAQDYIAQVAQGRVVDRSREWLGRSDACLIYLRQMFRRELDAIKEGRPGKQWTGRPGFARMPVPAGVPTAPDPE